MVAIFHGTDEVTSVPDMVAMFQGTEVTQIPGMVAMFHDTDEVTPVLDMVAMFQDTDEVTPVPVMVAMFQDTQTNKNKKKTCRHIPFVNFAQRWDGHKI